jgi:hypothetical protein
MSSELYPISIRLAFTKSGPWGLLGFLRVMKHPIRGTDAELPTEWISRQRGSGGHRKTLKKHSNVVDFVGRKAERRKGFTVRYSEIRNTSASSSAEKMKKLEQTQSDHWSTTREGRTDINFVRQARWGQWKETLPHISVARIESTWGS